MKTAAAHINICVPEGTFTIWEVEGQLYTPSGYKLQLPKQQLITIKEVYGKTSNKPKS